LRQATTQFQLQPSPVEGRLCDLLGGNWGWRTFLNNILLLNWY